MGGFKVGSIVAKLELDKKNWEKSIKGVKGDTTSLNGFILRNSDSIKKMGRTMTIAGGAIVGGLGLAVKAFAGFDKSMTESLAIMGNVSEGLKKEMADAAKEMSTKSTFAAKELAEAYFFLASAGMDAEQSIAALPAVTKFAQAGNFDLATATDLVTDAQTALGLSSKDATENYKNLVRVSDVLVGANTLANASVKQFAESLTNKAAAALVNVNKGLEEGVAVLAAYADKGIKGQLAGQRLTMMMNGLFDATRRNKKAWDEAGISLFNADESMRDVADIVQDLEGYLGAMTVKQREAALAALGFNLRTKDSILTLMGSSEKIRNWTEDLKNMGGITEEVSEKQLEAFSNKLKVLKNRLNVAAMEIGEKLVPTIEKMVAAIGKVAEKVTEWMDKHPKLTATIVKVAGAIGGLLLVLGPFFMMLPGIITALPLIGSAFTGLLGPIALVGGAIALLMTTIPGLKTEVGEAISWWGIQFKEASYTIQAGLLRIKYKGEELNQKLWELHASMHGLTLETTKGDRKLEEFASAEEEVAAKAAVLAKAAKEAAAAAAKLAASIVTTRKEGETLVPVTNNMVKVWDKFRFVGVNAMSVIEKAPATMKSWTWAMKTAVPPARDLMDIIAKAPAEFNDLERAVTETSKKIKIDWTSVADDMGRVWSEGFQGMMDETGTFADLLNSSFDTIASGVSSTLGKGLTSVLGIVGNLAGPIGGIFTGIISGAMGMFKKLLNIRSKAEKEAEKAAAAAAQAERQFANQVQESIVVMSKYGTISESTAEKIAELRKTHSGYTAESLAFNDVIKDVGVNQENINGLWVRAASIMDQMVAGEIDATKATEVLDDAFTQLKDGAAEFGKEGSAAMVSFILKVRESGIEVASVTEYVIGQLDRIPVALSTIIASQEETGQSLGDIGAIAVTTFKAMEAEGKSWNDVVADMSEPLAALKAKYEEQGIVAEGALAKMFKVVEVTEANKELFDALDANYVILEALRNSARLSEDDFKRFANQAYDDFKQLESLFGDDEAALRAMQPTLKILASEAEKYGWEIDENTARILQQAKDLGLVTEAQESEQEQQERLFEGLSKTMGEIIDKLGTRIEEALSGGFGRGFESARSDAEGTRGAIDREFSGLGFDIGIGYSYDKFEPPVGDIKVGVEYKYDRFNPPVNTNYNYSDVGGTKRPGFQGGVAFIPSGPTPIMVHSRELVDITPVSELSATGRSRAGLEMSGQKTHGDINVTINNTLNVPSSVNVTPQVLLDILDNNEDESTKKIAGYLDRYR